MLKNSPISDIRFDGGRLCLDFINTVHRRPPSDEDEYLRTLSDFLEWLVRKELLTESTARGLEKQAEAQADPLLNEIRNLRELLYRLFEPFAVRSRSMLVVTDRRRFEALIQAARSRQRLEWADGHAMWHSSMPDAPGLALADPILIDALNLLSAVELERVKQCDPVEGCGWLFLDRTKNRTRRWCSMETCGSAAKARAWYRRQQGRQD